MMIGPIPHPTQPCPTSQTQPPISTVQMAASNNGTGAAQTTNDGIPSSFLFLVVRPGTTGSDALVASSYSLLVVRPGATSSFLLLVAMPFAPSSVLVPTWNMSTQASSHHSSVISTHRLLSPICRIGWWDLLIHSISTIYRVRRGVLSYSSPVRRRERERESHFFHLKSEEMNLTTTPTTS